MPSRTSFLGRLIGLYMIVIALAMASHKDATVQTITAMLHDAPVLFVCGVIAVTGGLAIVLSHNVWSGGALPVMVTLTGWMALFKGTMLLVLTPEAESALFLDGLHYAQLMYCYCAVLFVLGAFLASQGFRASR
jgi:hypothetical protein